MHGAPEFLTSLAVVFCVAGVTTVVFQKLRQPVIFGYLVAGMIVGPHIPIPLVADPRIVQTLSELGVILLMFFLGLEFNLTKLVRIGPTAGVVALLQCSFMMWLGYEAGRMFGWPPLESFYAGAVVSLSSTVIIGAVFMEQGIKGKFAEIVFGILIVEDLIAIFLLTLLTAVSSGASLSARELAVTGGRLALFLACLLFFGMLTVPRLIRAVVRMNRPDTTLVASVGISFAFALLARVFGYSVALGAFIAGALVAESGMEQVVERTVKPMCDGFAAVFFVSVGMLIDPALVARYWGPVLVFFALVLAGNILGVSFWSFLAGHGIRNSVRAGMSLAQIGEFSFIIAALGFSTGATRDFLYPVAVTVSAATTLLNPWLIRWSGPAAKWVDRHLPAPLLTFAALYDSWLERMRQATDSVQVSRERRRRYLQMLIDIVLLVGILAAASAWRRPVGRWIASLTGFPDAAARSVFLAAVVFASGILCFTIYRGARRLALSLVERAFPEPGPGQVDLARAPRNVLKIALEIVILLVIAMPLLAFLQPFLPRFPGAVLLLAALVLAGISFWRRAANLEGHVKAVSQVIVESLARQGGARDEMQDEEALRDVRKLFPGLGHFVPLRLKDDSYCVGKTTGEMNIGNLTGAKILVVVRGEGDSFLPTGKDVLKAGDVLTLAGTPGAVEEAREILTRGHSGGDPPGTEIRGSTSS